MEAFVRLLEEIAYHKVLLPRKPLDLERPVNRARMALRSLTLSAVYHNWSLMAFLNAACFALLGAPRLHRLRPSFAAVALIAPGCWNSVEYIVAARVASAAAHIFNFAFYFGEVSDSSNSKIELRFARPGPS